MSQKLVMMRHLGFDQEYSLPDNCKATIEDGNTLCIYQEVPDPWTGEGLPPVGTLCEYQNSLGSWFPVEITAIAKKGICFVQTERDGENYVCQVSSRFRPIRTPEQIAEEAKLREWIAGIESAYGKEAADKCGSILAEADGIRKAKK